MKKILVLFFISAMACVGYSQNAGTLSGMTIEEFVEVLDDVKGYFFIGKGETRDLSLTLAREPNNDFDSAEQARDMDWYSYNDAIVSVNNTGFITGKAYGETILSTSNDGEIENYVVFVCPLITIVSPEGAIYSYHKVYNQKSRVQFTAGKDWEVNCVTRDGVLIGDSEIDAAGWYNSDESIDSDVRFHVTMAHKGNTLQDVKITVDGQDVTIHAPEYMLQQYNVEVLDMWNNSLYDGEWPSAGTLTFKSENKGIFTIIITDGGIENLYKIIIE